MVIHIGGNTKFSSEKGMLSERDLQLKSLHYRKALLRLIKTCGAGHTGGDLSCLDIINVLYNRIMRVSVETFKSPDRDYYIQSKGHCEALFVVLADRGFFPQSDLETLNRYGSHYIGHPIRDVNGVEQNTGALGHGLAVAVGIALAGKMDRKDYRVFTLLGDGELAEGSNWEAAMTAAHYRLDNLVAIVDPSNPERYAVSFAMADVGLWACKPSAGRLRAARSAEHFRSTRGTRPPARLRRRSGVSQPHDLVVAVP